MTGGYALRRLAQVVPTLVGVLVITFFVIHAAPGDPVVALAGEGADVEQVAAMRARFGLDRSLPVQFGAYAVRLAQGDLGTSIVRSQPVTSVIGERLPATLLLTGTAMVISTVGGIALGTLAARRPFARLDLGLNLSTLVGYSVPSFWLAQVALILLGLRAGIFPIQGMTNARLEQRGLPLYLDIAHHLALPALVLAASELALLTRLTRSKVVGELSKPYVRTARSMGVSGSRILVRHALPNALVPVVTVIGSRFGALVGGAVLVETVFAWPGLGQLLVAATRTRDYPVLLGMVLLASLSVMVANLASDLVAARVDPRIRLA